MRARLKIPARLIIYLMLLSILPLAIVGVTTYDIVRRTLSQVAGDYSRQLLNDQKDYLQLQLQLVEELASRIASIENITDIALRADQAVEGHFQTYDRLYAQAQIRQSLSQLSTLKGVTSVDLFTRRGNRFYVGDTLDVPEVPLSIQQDLLTRATLAHRNVAWLGIMDNLNPRSREKKVLVAVKILERFSDQGNVAEPVGMLVISYSTTFLSEHFSKAELGKDSHVLVSDLNQRLIYAPEPSLIGQQLPDHLQNIDVVQQHVSTTDPSEASVLASASCVAPKQWCVIGIIPEATLLAPIRKVGQVVLVMIMVCVGLIVIVSRIVRRDMVDPIVQITQGFQKIQKPGSGPAHALTVPHAGHEIAELVSWFNAFLESMEIRQRYEIELEEGRQKFSSIFQLSPVALALMNIDEGRFLDINDEWLQLFEFQRGEVLGRTSLELQLWDQPDDRQVIVEHIRRSHSVRRLEIKQRCRSGKVILCQLSAHPLTVNGEVVYVMAIVDVTRQREFEQQIRDMNSKLESRVRLRTLKLEQANRELEDAMASLRRTERELLRSEKLAALGALVAGIAHELNTPIGNCVTVASTIQDQSTSMGQALATGQIRKQTLEQFVMTVVQGSEILMRNLASARDLIGSFKQVAADQSSSQRREFDLKEMLQGVATTLAPIYRKTPFMLDLQLEDGIRMDSYPGPLGQIITNFLNNAIHHAFDGKIIGTMRLACRALDDDQVEIRFSDDGNGIPEQHVGRIFDPFFTTKLGQGGSGLGLNIVFNIVHDLLGGTITVHSGVGVGTEFVVLIPRVSPVSAN